MNFQNLQIELLSLTPNEKAQAIQILVHTFLNIINSLLVIIIINIYRIIRKNYIRQLYFYYGSNIRKTRYKFP